MTDYNQPSASTLYKLLALTMERSGLFRQVIDRRPKRKLRGWRIKAAMGRIKAARGRKSEPTSVGSGEFVPVAEWLRRDDPEALPSNLVMVGCDLAIEVAQ